MQRPLAVSFLFVLLALVAHGQSYHVYVSNERSGDVSVIDPLARRVVRTFAVGQRPRGIQVGPVSGRLYVAVSGPSRGAPGARSEHVNRPEAGRPEDGIAVIEPSTGRVLEVLRVGSAPEQFAIDEKESVLVVANENAAKATAWNLPTGTPLAEFPVGPEPEGVALRPGTAEVYVTCEGSGEVYILDLTARRELARLKIGGRPRSVTFTPDGRQAFVAAEGRKSVAVIDAMARTVSTQIPVKGGSALPMMALVSLDAKQVFVSTGRGNTVAVLDPLARRNVATIRTGQRPWGLAQSPDGQLLFSANGESDDVSVIDVATLYELGRVKAGAGPWGLAIIPSRRR